MATSYMSSTGLTTGPRGSRPSFLLSEYIIFKGILSKKDLKNLLVNQHYRFFGQLDQNVIKEINKRRYLNCDSMTGKYPKILYKMMKSENANKLCDFGSVMLGSIPYYAKTENTSIRDGLEGSFLSLAIGKNLSVASLVGTGNHVLCFCTTEDQSVRFDGYDACVEIREPSLFANLVSQSLKKELSGHVMQEVILGSCNYQFSRVIIGKMHDYNEALMHLGELSVETVDVLSNHKFRLKPARYAHESEFRMAFVMDHDVPSYVALKCPEIRNLCRRLW